MDSIEFRSHFPIFKDGVHLCSCSEGALSDRVMVAMSEFMTSWRIHAAPWEYWMDEVDKARQEFAWLINANPDDIAAVSCASEAAFQVAWAQEYSSRPGIVTNDLEFPSIAHVWLGQQQRGAQVRFIEHNQGVIKAEDYATAIDHTTRLVSIPLVSYANGLRIPIEPIITRAHQAGARVVVDAYQGAGIVPVDVKTLGCDYLIAGTLKYLLGAPGIAFLWVKPGLEHPQDPALTGWFGRKEPFAFTPKVLDYSATARRFQTGTPAIPAAFMASAGLSLINEISVAEAFRHVQALAQRAQDALSQQGWEFFSPTEPQYRGPQVTIHTEAAEDIAAYLSSRRIFVSPRGAAVRISLHFYNNEEDIDRVVEALENFRRQGNR